MQRHRELSRGRRGEGCTDMAANPIISISDGVRYKRVREGAGRRSATVTSWGCYSISTAGGSYMYSRGFGFEKDSDGVNGLAISRGCDSAIKRPKGIELALRGMKRG